MVAVQFPICAEPAQLSMISLSHWGMFDLVWNDISDRRNLVNCYAEPRDAHNLASLSHEELAVERAAIEGRAMERKVMRDKIRAALNPYPWRPIYS